MPHKANVIRKRDVDERRQLVLVGCYFDESLWNKVYNLHMTSSKAQLILQKKFLGLTRTRGFREAKKKVVWLSWNFSITTRTIFVCVTRFFYHHFKLVEFDLLPLFFLRSSRNRMKKKSLFFNILEFITSKSPLGFCFASWSLSHQ